MTSLPKMELQSSICQRYARILFLTLVIAARAIALIPTSTDFGTANVNGAGSTHTISFSLSGLSSAPTEVFGGIDFSSGSLSCNSGNTACSVSVTFFPKSVGLKLDSVSLKNSAGQVVASAFVHGIGVAPALRVFPSVISTYAGSGQWTYLDGSLSAAGFRSPQGLAVGIKGNIFVADSVNQVVRKIFVANSTVTTYAGNTNAGFSGDGGLAANATLNTPTGLALDAAANLFIADQGNGVIRRVDAVTGIISTVAGGGISTANNVPATSAALSGPNDVAFDIPGNLYISDSFHNLIRKVSLSSGLITTVAGGGGASGADGIGDGGLATAAQLSDPTGITLDASGNIYFADTGHSLVRRIDASTGIITVVAGTGALGVTGDGGLATSATLVSPTGVRLDADNDIYIADFGGQVVRFVNSSTGIISTLAGVQVAGHSGDGNFATLAQLSGPSDVALSQSGSIYIADYANNCIRNVVSLPQTLTFPNTNVSLTSAMVPLTLLNQGNATLGLSALSLSGSFHQQSSGSGECTASTTLSPGASCQVSLVFLPSTSGTSSGTLTIGSNDANLSGSQISINLSGAGISGTPTAILSSTSVSFLNQPVGSVSPVSTITLRNGGTSALALSTIDLTGSNSPDFSISSTTCVSSLAVNATCTIALTFNPSTSGSRTATLQISDSAANSPQSITLSGTATMGAQPATNISSLQFSSLLMGTPSAAQTVTITNTGVTTLGISGISVGGVNGVDFSIYSYTCGSTLAASASCNVNIRFTPGAVGARTGSLMIAFAGALASQVVTLSGTGLPLPCVTSLAASNQVYLAAGASDTLAVAAPAGCSWTVAVNSSSVAFTNSAFGTGPGAVAFTVAANSTAQPRVATFTAGSVTLSAYQMGVGLRFVPVIPCRAVDTRNPNGPSGGPSLAPATPRSFNIPASPCGIPANAQSYSLNVAAVPHNGFHYLTIWPTGQAQPLVANLNSVGQVKSNAAIVPAGVNGSVSVYATDAMDLVLDINGYFVIASGNADLDFYPLSPCRVVDTRLAGGPLGGPYIGSGGTRVFPLQSGSCNIPSTAQAYSVNFAAVPRTSSLAYLTAWPTGAAQPNVSTLNGSANKIIANAAIVGAGSGGAISLYATDATDVIIDINGYFAPPASGGLMLYNVNPCRALDTRIAPGAQFLNATTFNLTTCPVPPQVRSYVLQAAVVPSLSFRYLSLWPAGTAQPLVATLNDDDGQITSNLAIVPTSNGSISAANGIGPADLILDMFAIFAP